VVVVDRGGGREDCVDGGLLSRGVVRLYVIILFVLPWFEPYSGPSRLLRTAAQGEPLANHLARVTTHVTAQIFYEAET
jgi:hypothetical protein